MTDEKLYEYVKTYYGVMSLDEMWRELYGKVTMLRLRDMRSMVRQEKGDKTDAEILAYIKKHWKNKTDRQMAGALEVAVTRVTAIRKKNNLLHGYFKTGRHLCWDCKKATSAFECIYVASCIGNQDLQYYAGTEVKGGLIKKCPEFEEG